MTFKSTIPSNNPQVKDRTHLFNRLFQVPNNWHNVLYVHTPFCVQKCFYCVYSSKEPSNPEELAHFYEQVLPTQIETYRPTLEHVAFDQVYFGGGTPSIGDASTIEKVFETIPRFREIPVKMSEASPFTVTDEHLDLYHRYGFRFISFGVQTLVPGILQEQNRRIVSVETLQHLCRVLDRYQIISNLDLIFYLDKGGLDDLAYSREDMRVMMSEIQPVSITIHSSYLAKKSIEKQLAMIWLIREMLALYPQYRCINALLEESELEEDMNFAAEYRLMRCDQDFHSYMTPKIPEAHHYGHNMIALGAYEKFRPRYNYYYIFDYMDKYSFRAMMDKYRFIADNFKNTRQKLQLPFEQYMTAGPFFPDEQAQEQFKSIIKEYGLPFLQFPGI